MNEQEINEDNVKFEIIFEVLNNPEKRNCMWSIENCLPELNILWNRRDKQIKKYKRMIEIMAEHLTTNTHGKDWVIKYFEDEVELEKEDC